MRKLWSSLLAFVLALSMLSGWAYAQAMYTPGTYVGESGGRNGVVKVEVEFSEDAILSASGFIHSL